MRKNIVIVLLSILVAADVIDRLTQDQTIRIVDAKSNLGPVQYPDRYENSIEEEQKIWIKRNEPYRLAVTVTTPGGNPISGLRSDQIFCTLSKDWGKDVPLTDSTMEESTSHPARYYVDLTAPETNANKLVYLTCESPHASTSHVMLRMED